jgi:hypothetical protein
MYFQTFREGAKLKVIYKIVFASHSTYLINEYDESGDESEIMGSLAKLITKSLLLSFFCVSHLPCPSASHPSRLTY